jgi:hypothetical protein
MLTNMSLAFTKTMKSKAMLDVYRLSQKEKIIIRTPMDNI